MTSTRRSFFAAIGAAVAGAKAKVWGGEPLQIIRIPDPAPYYPAPDTEFVVFTETISREEFARRYAYIPDRPLRQNALHDIEFVRGVAWGERSITVVDPDGTHRTVQINATEPPADIPLVMEEDEEDEWDD